MPRGFDGVRAAAQDIASRAQSGGSGDDLDYFKLKGNNESRVVRFLEEGNEIHWAWVHEMPPRGKQRWGDNVACLDQDGAGNPCPACERGMPKSFLGVINLIEFDGPKFATDGNGRKDYKNVVGKETKVSVWERGIQTFEELDGKDATYKGLKSRRFRITRKGTGMNDTRYIIEPEDPDSGPQEWTDEEKALAANKPDLTPLVTPPAYDKMKEWLGAGNGNGGSQDSPVNSEVEINPFV